MSPFRGDGEVESKGTTAGESHRKRSRGGRLSVAKAASLLQLSERQVQRLKQRYQSGTTVWVKHGNAGRSKSWALDEKMRTRIIELARGKYAGFNDTHLWEKLTVHEGLIMSRETVRRTLRQAKIASPQKRRAKKYRSRRERRSCWGAMVLADASRHDWLEDRGPRLTLLGFQDDATSQVLAAPFQLEPENTLGYLRTLRQLLERHGIPLSLYRDQHGTFQRNDKHGTREEELAGRQDPTHLGRALEERGVQQIAALSPQAKGRIERCWRTFQDRLISELRLARASTLEQATIVLESFIGEHNRRFAVPARETTNSFRSLSRSISLDRVLSLRYERSVGADHVITLGAHAIQLPPFTNHDGFAGKRVELSHQLDGTLCVWLGAKLLHSQPLPLAECNPRPSSRKRATPKPKLPRIYSFAGRPAIAARP
jgi:transposase